MLGMPHWQRQDTGFDPLCPPTIPYGTLRPAAFAHGDAPGLALIALAINELLVSPPAQHEAQGKGHHHPQPEGGGKPLIKDMHHRSLPLHEPFHQELAFFIAFEGGDGSA